MFLPSKKSKNFTYARGPKHCISTEVSYKLAVKWFVLKT